MPSAAIHLPGMQGTVRKVMYSEPGSPDLLRLTRQDGRHSNARLAVLFSNGRFGVWELDSKNELRSVMLQSISRIDFPFICANPTHLGEG